MQGLRGIQHVFLECRGDSKLPNMWLPVPTPEMVNEFRALVREHFALELDEKAATRAATQLIQIHYLLAYANRDLRPQINRIRGTSSSES
jgi:hypothetical protein